MPRTSKQRAFLSKVRTGEAARKTVNPTLEKMVQSLLEQAADSKSSLTFEQKMDVGALALKLEAVRNKIGDADYGTGFLDREDSAEAPTGAADE